MDKKEMPESGAEGLSENLARIKERLLAGSLVGSYEAPEDMGGAKVEKLYDTGNEPDTGTSRDDEAVLKVTEQDGTVSYAKVGYYYRAHKFHDVEFVNEAEANKFIEEQSEYFKPYWEEKK